jgi:hypothetical protein
MSIVSRLAGFEEYNQGAIIGVKETTERRYYISSLPADAAGSGVPCASTGTSRTACTGAET